MDPKSTRPKVTPDHIEKYHAIMKTQVKPTVPTVSDKPKGIAPSVISAMLSAIPRPKGIGNKMFIFTGNRKIIMEGSEREVEKVKTVDPAREEREKKKEERKVEAKKEAEKPHSPPVPDVVKGPAEHIERKKKQGLPLPVKIAGLVVLYAIWGILWAYIFGYFKF